MKFSEINSTEWSELKPYLDTCLLPLTGLTGKEQPWEAAERLEKLRDLMDLVEIPFRGRVVTYPAVQYKTTEELFSHDIDRLCSKLKECNFKFVILITPDPAI